MEALPNAGSRVRGFLLGTGAGAAVTALWVALSLATDLIWHLHPVLVGAAGGWAYRRGLGDAGGRVEVAALVVLTAALVGLGGALIAVGDKRLDAGWFVGLVAAVGLAFGLRVLTRSPRGE